MKNVYTSELSNGVKFAVIDGKYYIEKLDILNHPYYSDNFSEDDDVDNCLEISRYFYLNYKSPNIPDFIWHREENEWCEPDYIRFVYIHIDELLDKLYDNEPIAIDNKTPESLELLNEKLTEQLEYANLTTFRKEKLTKLLNLLEIELSKKDL